MTRTGVSPQAIAFDTAIKSWSDFDYRGLADLEELRHQDSALSEIIDQLVQIRQAFNDALAVEGQNISGDAPHAPFYLDFIDSDRSNARAFKDANHSFIGVNIPLVFDVLHIARLLSASDTVVSSIGLPLENDREWLRAVLFWMLLGFIISHEYAHHVHGHLGGAFDVEEIIGGALTGNLARQAREADADGWAAYLTLAHWVTAGGRQALCHILHIDNSPSGIQDDVSVACLVIAQSAFTFLREPEPIDKDTVYWRTHPPQPVRLQLMSRFVLKFSGEFRPSVRETLTQPRYQSLLDAVSRLMWTNGNHASLWHEQAEFLGTTDGVAYYAALIAELDAFRATLRQWDTEARPAWRIDYLIGGEANLPDR